MSKLLGQASIFLHLQLNTPTDQSMLPSQSDRCLPYRAQRLKNPRELTSIICLVDATFRTALREQPRCQISRRFQILQFLPLSPSKPLQQQIKHGRVDEVYGRSVDTAPLSPFDRDRSLVRFVFDRHLYI